MIVIEVIEKVYYKNFYMQNFFSPEQRASYEDAFESIHESFGRDVLIVKDSKRVIVTQTSDEFNYFYSDYHQDCLQETTVPVSGVFKMRIRWDDPNNELFFDNPGMDVIRPKIHANLCRLKMRQDAFDFLIGFKQFIVDEKRCEWVGFSRPHGIISNNFYTVMLKESN